MKVEQINERALLLTSENHEDEDLIGRLISQGLGDPSPERPHDLIVKITTLRGCTEKELVDELANSTIDTNQLIEHVDDAVLVVDSFAKHLGKVYENTLTEKVPEEAFECLVQAKTWLDATEDLAKELKRR